MVFPCGFSPSPPSPPHLLPFNLDFKQVNYKKETKGFNLDESKKVLICLLLKNILDLNFTFLKYMCIHIYNLVFK